MKIVFSPREGASFLLRNGKFSMTRWKRAFKAKVRDTLSSASEGNLRFGRVTIRQLDLYHQHDFFLDLSLQNSRGQTEWTQTFRFAFTDPGKNFNGVLIPGKRRHAK